jgi:hypothetical protein
MKTYLIEACLKGLDAEELIPLKNNVKPHKAPLRSYTPAEKVGVIEKTKSPWQHLPVVIPKRGGGSRIAINYRLVNAETVFDDQSFPSTEDSLQVYEGAQ